MKNYSQFKKETLKDNQIRKKYKKLSVEFALIEKNIETKIKKD